MVTPLASASSRAEAMSRPELLVPSPETSIVRRVASNGAQRGVHGSEQCEQGEDGLNETCHCGLHSDRAYTIPASAPSSSRYRILALTLLSCAVRTIQSWNATKAGSASRAAR